MLISKLRNFIGQKQRNWIGQHYLACGPTVQVHVLSTPWACTSVGPSTKVNCCPWVTVHFALGTTVLRTGTK